MVGHGNGRADGHHLHRRVRVHRVVAAAARDGGGVPRSGLHRAVDAVQPAQRAVGDAGRRRRDGAAGGGRRRGGCASGGGRAARHAAGRLRPAGGNVPSQPEPAGRGQLGLGVRGRRHGPPQQQGGPLPAVVPVAAGDLAGVAASAGGLARQPRAGRGGGSGSAGGGVAGRAPGPAPAGASAAAQPHAGDAGLPQGRPRVAGDGGAAWQRAGSGVRHGGGHAGGHRRPQHQHADVYGGRAAVPAAPGGHVGPGGGRPRRRVRAAFYVRHVHNGLQLRDRLTCCFSWLHFGIHLALVWQMF